MSAGLLLGICYMCIEYFLNACEGLHCNEIQESLCDAVNNLVKHFYKPEKEASFADFCPVFVICAALCAVSVTMLKCPHPV